MTAEPALEVKHFVKKNENLTSGLVKGFILFYFSLVLNHRAYFHSSIWCF